MASLMKKLKTVYPYQQNTSSGKKRVKAMRKSKRREARRKRKEGRRKGKIEKKKNSAFPIKQSLLHLLMLFIFIINPSLMIRV